jgi:hypothetical protein
MLESMRAMHELLRGEATPEETGKALGGAPPERLAAYQGFVRGHIEGILTKAFPTLAELVGHCAWHAVGREFFRDVPPADYELNACAEAFPAWLSARIEAGESDLSEFHVEVAELHLAEFAAFADEARIPAPGDLDAPTLNPTLRVLELTYPVAEFVARWRRREREGAPPVPAEPAPEVVFVFREPGGFRHRFERADDNLLFAFKVVHDGVPLAEAAEAAGAPEALVRQVLGEAAEAGLVILPETWFDPGDPGA